MDFDTLCFCYTGSRHKRQSPSWPEVPTSGVGMEEELVRVAGRMDHHAKKYPILPPTLFQSRCGYNMPLYTSTNCVSRRRGFMIP